MAGPDLSTSAKVWSNSGSMVVAPVEEAASGPVRGPALLVQAAVLNR